ncbi:ATP-binding protein [Piscinibacter sakaiensis]|nr:PAS domain-containing sensor histidine kinase [Piscinibacter sakaiensis]
MAMQDRMQLPLSQPVSGSGPVLGILAVLASLVLLASVGLMVYLHRFESAENLKRQSANAFWLEETLRFHLRRLEGDLEGLALQSAGGPPGRRPATVALGGSIRAYEDGLKAHGWRPAGQAMPAELRACWTRSVASAGNEDAIGAMLDMAQGLRRPAYTAPLTTAAQPVPDEIWMAVPIFGQGQYLGAYIAVFSLSRSIELVVPAWFRLAHEIRIVDPEQAGDRGDAGEPEDHERQFLASVDMPGSDTYLQVRSLTTQHASEPRALLAVALLFLAGMAVSLLLLRKDIVIRRRAEHALASQVALRRSMEDSIGIGLFARDLGGAIVYTNRAFDEMVRPLHGVMLGRNASLLGWPGTMHGSQEEPEFEFEFRRTAHGEPLRLVTQTVPLVQDGDIHIGWMTSVVDVTERRRAEEAAQAQQLRMDAAGRLVAVGEVASTLAHELNQPLGAISSFASGLVNRIRLGNIDSPQIHGVAERIALLAEKAGEIIRRVNAFARRREMERAPVELRAFLRGRWAGDGSTPVRIDLSALPGHLIVLADVVLLEQAIHNVLQNAIEAAQGLPTPPAPEVLLKAYRSDDGSEAVIDVSDSGPGIDATALHRLFEPFYSSKSGGMGMGLSIVRSILEAHHGRVEVVRRGDLGGATFKMRIPCIEAT